MFSACRCFKSSHFGNLVFLIFRIFEFSNVSSGRVYVCLLFVFELSSVQVFELSSFRVFKLSRVRPFEFSDLLSFKVSSVFKFSDFQVSGCLCIF